MSLLVCSPQGRFGNQCLQVLFCRAFAERFGHDFRVEPWVGERIFQVSDPHYDGPPLPDCGEVDLLRTREHMRDCRFRGYAQLQGCAAIYSKRAARNYFELRREVLEACVDQRPADDTILCHLRRGDYQDLGYVVVHQRAYMKAMARHGLDPSKAKFISEESPTPRGRLPEDLAFMADFYRLMTAPTLLRANSSFSWLAALLSDERNLVLSPIVEGLEGGKEQDCWFVPGNHPRFANLDYVQDLHIAP